MKREEVIHRLWKLLIETGYERLRNCSPEELKDELLVDLGLDSISLLQLMVGVEIEFGIEWRASDVNAITLSTLDTIASFLLMETHNEALRTYTLAKQAVVGEAYFQVHRQPTSKVSNRNRTLKV